MPGKWTAKYIRKLQKKLPIVIDRKNDYRNTVLLAGTARSGTTWVADIINYNNDYRLMFEPFQARKVDLVKHFKHGQYIRPDNKDDKFLRPAKKILSGRLKNPDWVDKDNRRVFCSKRLIKTIHANLMLKWIKVNFPEIPIILLIRHPCAVALSRLRLKDWDWVPDFKECISQTELIDEYLRPMKSYFDKAKDLFDIHIFSWCIANYVPLHQFKPGEIHLVFYESLCTKPEMEIDRLFSFLGEPYDTRVFKTIRIASELSRKDSAIKIGKNLIDDFKNHISRDQFQRAVEILNLFGLDKVYSEDPMPLIDNEQNLLSFSESLGIAGD